MPWATRSGKVFFKSEYHRHRENKKTIFSFTLENSDRLGHVINNETTEQSPLFLLFLDCTWQLLQQFPEDFEFSETFLTTIWDSAFMPLFDTFQFNSEHDREAARQRVSLCFGAGFF